MNKNTDMHNNKASNGALIGALRESGWTMRGIASVVILTFGSLVTAPAYAAVKQEVQKIQWHKADQGPGANLSAHLMTIRDHMKAATGKSLESASFGDERKQLKDDAAVLADLDQKTLGDFASTRAMIQQKHLPDVIVQREAKAEDHYKTEMAALREGLDSVANEKDDAKAQAKSQDVLKRLSQFQMERTQQKFDPKHLPNRSLKPDLSRKPLTTKKQFADAGFTGNPRLMVASNAPNFDYSQLPGANNPAYLAATTEVTLSPAIQAQAAALNYDPVKINNWVRNNIQWQPTWGAVQDADLTLSAQRGNAFDISSLLIALLRASNIPARYVLGTINVPQDKFRNWVGGFQNINAAVNYASAGGIPITSLYAGGQITTIQMQHIWVEAAIDYMPSHGAINKSADTWVPMDASYKQYSFQQGLNPLALSGVDPNALSQQYFASGTVDTTDSWISGLNFSVLQTAQQSGQTAMQNYVNQNLPNATVTQLMGGVAVLGSAGSMLSASLPYQIVVKGVMYGALPAQLEQSITLSLGVDALGAPQNAVTFPWAQLNNQQVILSFVPATPADQQVLDSLVPKGIVDPSQIPSTIPAYLINMVPQIKVNDTVVDTGVPLTMGQEMVFGFTPNFAGRNSIPNTYSLVAGSYVDVAVVAGNVSPSALAAAATRMQNTQATLQTKDPSQFGTLNSERLLGDMFQAGMLLYYGQYIAEARIIGSGQSGYQYLAGGVGTFGYEPHVDYVFGVPRDINIGGTTVNVPIINVTGYDSADINKLRNYQLQIGVLSSALESTVPTQMFGSFLPSSTTVSAVAAITVANQQGQKLYQLTPSNESTTLPAISHNSVVMQDIQDALASGKEVITHASDVSIPGWTGAGYIIFDPQTGDGAYKIGGGQNGGFQPSISFNPITGLTVQIPGVSESQLFGAGLSSAELAATLEDDSPTGQLASVIGSVSSITDSVTAIVTTLAVQDAPCLMSDQRQSLEDALDQLGQLSWINSIPPIEPLPEVSVPMVSVAQYIGYLYVLEATVNFIKINSALGDCGLK